MRSRTRSIFQLGTRLAVGIALMGPCALVARATGDGDVPSRGAATMWVDDDWTGPRNCGGHTWQVDAFKHIQDGIDAATSPGGTVVVHEGTYVENIDFGGKIITVRSMEPFEPGAVNSTIIDGNDAGPVVTFDSGETTDSKLIGFTITNGNAPEGGGIYCSLSSPTISDNVVTENHAVPDIAGDYGYGGGIYCWSCSPLISDNRIHSNFADRGGGIYGADSSSASITGNVIRHNRASYSAYGRGGGIYLDASSPSITDSDIHHNYAQRDGGGIYCRNSSSPTITGNDIHHNEGRYDGGGIYCRDSSSFVISGNEIHYNKATHGKGLSGGILCLSSSPSITNNRIHHNYTCCFGAGIYYKGVASPTISGNEIYDGKVGISCGASPVTTISDNDIHGNHVGIRCFGSSPILVGNYIHGNKSHGVYCSDASPTISQSVISGNSASKGGGIYCGGATSSPSISNTTICLNSGSGADAGGGVHCWKASPTITNSIIAYTTDGTGVHAEEGAAPTITYCLVYNNADGNYSGITDPTGTNGNLAEDPLLANVGAGDFHLKSGGGRWNPTTSTWVADSVYSPCIDAGDPASDYSNEPTRHGGRINMGAYGNTAEASKSPAVTLEWLGTGGYTSDGVTPDLAKAGTTFTFKVRYTDPLGGDPLKARCLIYRRLGTAWKLYKNLPLAKKSGSVATGVVYSGTRVLANYPWKHRFYFQAADGTWLTDDPPCSWQQGPRIKGPPRLYWTGEAGYTADGVHPNKGPAGATFTFSVLYQDSDGKAPDTHQLLIRRNNTPYKTINMAEGAGEDYRHGKPFSASMVVPKSGPYKYRFRFFEGGAQAKGDPVAWKSGPSITESGALIVSGLSTVPTNVGAQLTFTLSSPAQIEARVLNIAGRPVKTVCSGRGCDAGANTLLWNAMSDSGVRVPNGVYLVEVAAKAEDGSQTRALAQVRVGR